MPVLKDSFHIRKRGRTSECLHFLSTVAGMHVSGHEELAFISSIAGFSRGGNDKSGLSGWLKTDVNWSWRMSASFFLSVCKLPFESKS